MHGTVPAQAQGAIFTDAQSYSDKKSSARLCGFVEEQWFKRLCLALFKSKPGATLHYLTAVPERTCQSYAAGSREPSGDFIIKLLRSTDGARVLAHAMRGCTQPWWQRAQLAEIVLAAKLRGDAEIQEQAKQLELQL